MTLKLTFAGFNYVADVDGSYASDATAGSLGAMQTQTASNSVALTDDYGINAATNTVYADYNSGGVTGNTETIANLTATIKEAEGRGLTVMVRPLIDFTTDASTAMLKGANGNQYANGDWRAYYNIAGSTSAITAANVTAFFNSYDTMIVAQAKAAQAGGAQLLDIGTEIDQLTGPAYLSNWTKIISDVRAVYTGKLTYSAISDDDLSPWQNANFSGVAKPPPVGTGDITTQVSFWSQLDYVGIDEYAAISDASNGGTNPDPTLAQLVAGWENTPTDMTTLTMTGGKSLIAYYEGVSAALGKPLLFTEIGYNSAPDAATQPFFTSSNTYDPTLQANLYKAFFQAWQDQGNTSLQGVYIWDWEPNPATVGAGTDPSWTPQGNAGAIQVVDAAYAAATTPAGGPNDAYVWAVPGAGNGDWDLPQDWIDVATGAAYLIPGSTNATTIAGGTTAALTITDLALGIGNSASLAVTNQVTLNGNFVTGALTIGTAALDATLTDISSLNAASGTVVNGTLAASGKTVTLVMSGSLALGGGASTNNSDYQTLTAAAGALIRLGGLTLGATNNFYVNNYVGVDAGSTIEVGTRGGATAGALTIDPGNTVSGPGTIGTNLYNFGTLNIQGGALYVQGVMNGAGSTTIGAGATLDAQALIGSVTFGGAGGKLVLHPGSIASQGQTIQVGLQGFGKGDTIDLANTVITSLHYQPGTGGGTLTAFSGASQVAAFSLNASYSASQFNLTTDAAGTGSAIGYGAVADDFNGDGKSDLLLQNTNGAIVAYDMSGLAVSGAVFVNNPGPTWHVVGEADFNGDGQPDILLQNDNGSIVDYLMNGSTVIAANSLSNPGPGWHVRGTGDFNGDGKADMLLQNDNGAMVLFDTNGSGITAGYNLGQLPAGWAIEGVGDFNGDGVPDVLVQSNTGTLVDFTTGSTGAGFASGATVANIGPGWTVAGTADYNGDGKADILLHNDGGADVVFLMNGATVTGTVAVGNPGAAYQGGVTGIDINGDGLSDLVVQSTNSTLVGYTLGTNAAITAGAVLNVPGAGWNLLGGNPTTFIDGTGSTLALTGTPGPDQFNLTTTTAGVHTIASFDPAQDAVALSAAAFPTYAAVQANEAAYQGGTFINLSPSAAIIIQGVTPGQLGSGNFVLR